MASNAAVPWRPLAWEPFDVALPETALAALDPLLAELERRRGQIEALGGYDLTPSGEITRVGR